MIDPIAFRLGPISIHWYGILIALAFLIGITGSAREVRKADLDEDAYYSLVIWTVIASLFGARLYYVLFEWPYYSLHPEDIIAVWKGGLAIHGGLLAGALTLFIGSKHYKFRFWELADKITPYLILGQGIGRWGNYINQEAYGYAVDPADIPWAMYIDGAWRHPTFLYESLWDVMGFFFLMTLSRKVKTQEGDIGLAYLMFYSSGRFVIESFRTDSLMLGPLRMAQVVSLFLALLSLLIFIFKHQKGKASGDKGN